MINLAACNKCKHYLHEIQNPSAPGVWYNHFCKACPNPDRFDPITGRYEPDLHPYKNCRDINYSGQCAHYEEASKEDDTNAQE